MSPWIYVVLVQGFGFGTRGTELESAGPVSDTIPNDHAFPECVQSCLKRVWQKVSQRL